MHLRAYGDKIVVEESTNFFDLSSRLRDLNFMEKSSTADRASSGQSHLNDLLFLIQSVGVKTAKEMDYNLLI